MNAESALVDAAVAGDRDAFDELVRRYQVSILSLTRALLAGCPEAEDVAQEAFVRAWRSISGFRRESSFKTWMQRIAVNMIISHQRHQTRERRVFRNPDAHERAEVDRFAAPGDLHSEVLLRLSIDRALARLPFDLRAVVVLRDIHGMDYKDIAATLRVPIGTVESRIFRARQRLREWLRTDA